MAKIRFPAQVDLKSRDGTTNKDQLLVNGIVEVQPSKKQYTLKRPGLSTMTTALNGGGYGTYFYNSNLYAWTGSSIPTVLSSVYIGGGAFSGWSSWAVGSTYTTGNNVTYPTDDTLPYDPNTNPSTTYYAMANIPSGTKPTSNTHLWSKTPPPTHTRYIGHDSSGTLSTEQCGSLDAAGYRAWLMFETYQSCSPGHSSFAVYTRVQNVNIYPGSPWTWYAEVYSNLSPGDCSNVIDIGENNRGGVSSLSI